MFCSSRGVARTGLGGGGSKSSNSSAGGAPPGYATEFWGGDSPRLVSLDNGRGSPDEGESGDEPFDNLKGWLKEIISKIFW